MKKKHQLTAFSRLLIFLLFFIPISYIGSQYIQGEDGIAKVKSFFKSNPPSIEQQILDKKDEISKTSEELIRLQNELRALENSQ